MEQSTKDKAEGKAHEIKGAVKQKTGEIFHNEKMEADGAAERFEGKVQKNVGKVEAVVEDLVK